MTHDKASIEELLEAFGMAFWKVEEAQGSREELVAAREALRSRFLEQQKELEERSQEISRLAGAWFTYTRTATVGDGHTLDCGRWADLANGCTCGLRELEDAIENLVNPAIQPEGTPQK